MNEAKLYYTPPSNEAFQEVKEASMKLWKIVDTDDDKYGYATEKINQIKDIGNVGDNFMYMVAMFDINNQQKLSSMLSEETKLEISKRFIDSGGGDYNVFG